VVLVKVSALCFAPLLLCYYTAIAPLSLRYRPAIAPLSPRYRPAIAPLSPRYRPAIAPLSPRYRSAIAPLSPRYRPAIAPLSPRYRSARLSGKREIDSLTFQIYRVHNPYAKKTLRTNLSTAATSEHGSKMSAFRENRGTFPGKRKLFLAKADGGGGGGSSGGAGGPASRNPRQSRFCQKHKIFA